MTFSEMEKATGSKFSPRNESDYESAECWYTDLLNSPDPQVGYMMKNNRLVRIDIYDLEGAKAEALVTDSGFGVGSLETEITKYYGGRLKREVHPYIGKEGSYLRVKSQSAKGVVLFETDNGKVTRFRVGLEPQVDYIEGCS